MRIRDHLSLRSRIYSILFTLIAIALVSGSIMVWYTYRIQKTFTNIIERHMAAYEQATFLETALVNQRGFVTYYFLDANPDWLNRLEEHRQVFRKHLADAQQIDKQENHQKVLQRISDEYSTYVVSKDRVIALYKSGQRDEGAVLHKAVRQHFFDILTLCEDYKNQHQKQILNAYGESRQTARRLRFAIIATIAIQILLFVGLGIIFIRGILSPIYRMLLAMSGSAVPFKSENVVTALGTSVNHLLEDFDKTQSALQKSRENLLQAEKMALVGKLAASMAHSIRNPFTSIKMRMFSLNRSLKMDIAQEEDFEVIAQEIRHIDNIVQNFLEFSRPPKLAMQLVSPSAIVDTALQLLKHRLVSYGVEVKLIRPRTLPTVMADPEQLKEVLVNLIINACEAMKTGGMITINESVASGSQNNAMIRMTDSGSGIPSSIKEKIFQPFFTTKEEGTGLGLSIADRIIKEHGGSIIVDPSPNGGAAFLITLPLEEQNNG